MPTKEQIDQTTTKVKPGRPLKSAVMPVAVQVNHEALAEDSHAADTFAALQAGYSDDRDLLNQLLGQAQMADAFAKFSVTVTTSKLAFVKENKLYQSLKGKETGDGHQFSGTWEEFCGLLGRSREQVDEDLRNLKSLGAEALDSMSRMGIGYRELRQYRKLPEDQKLALIEVAKTGDKEGFVDLAEEIIARHAKEKEALAAQVQEAQESLEAKDKVLETNAARITSLEEQTSRKFKPRADSEARTAHEQTLLTELEGATSATFLGLHRTFLAANETLSDSGVGAAIQARARQSIEFLIQQLADMAEEFHITVDLESRINPTWLDEDALNVLEARNASNNGASTN